jgi:hypothetical protein
VYTLLRADLLAKRRDAGVSDERGVERIHAFPRCVSCMGAAKAPLSMSAAGRQAGGGGAEGQEGGCWMLGRTYGCPKYSTERFCSAREDTNPSSSVSPATG